MPKTRTGRYLRSAFYGAVFGLPIALVCILGLVGLKDPPPPRVYVDSGMRPLTEVDDPTLPQLRLEGFDLVQVSGSHVTARVPYAMLGLPLFVILACSALAVLGTTVLDILRVPDEGLSRPGVQR